MNNRTVSLDSKPRNTVTIEVAGVSFQITRVVIGARKLFGELMQDMGKYLELTGKLEEKFSHIGEDPENRKALDEEIKQVSKEIEEFSEDKLNRYMEIIRILLEKNGYTFDRDWWIENCEQADLQFFINEAMNKDVDGSKKKNPGK